MHKKIFIYQFHKEILPFKNSIGNLQFYYISKMLFQMFNLKLQSKLTLSSKKKILALTFMISDIFCVVKKFCETGPRSLCVLELQKICTITLTEIVT